MLLTSIRSTRRRATQRAAFTLLEVLIVVAILVILASAASISLFRYLDDAKVGKAKTEMNTILGAVKKYYTEKMEWPDSSSLVTTIGPMIEGNQTLTDPWGGQYVLIVQGEAQADGTQTQRAFIRCQPPGKPLIQVPEK
ncbi:MAG TPA: type II secretion system protein [Gemmata sp.]|jgi:general secretion pathway protein G|nr:type II secretion system protein [Gemmata sp.]